MKNHTGTHVLNFSLQKVLGEVDQKGSLVAPDRMRFDFSAKAALTPAQVKEVEEHGQALIDTKNSVFAKESQLNAAKQIKGLRAVFSETYPDPVRVVCVGVPIEKLLSEPDSDLGTKTSVEFCGGTHLQNVSHIGHLVITQEESIAKGTRRIVAITGPEAEKAIERSSILEERLTELKTAIEQAQKDTTDKEIFKKQIQDFLNELNSQLLPYWKKNSFRETANTLQKACRTVKPKQPKAPKQIPATKVPT